MFDAMIPPLLAYFAYVASGSALLAVFSWLYCRATPLDEIALIRQHNQAAAISFGGALLGFSLALASSAWHLNTLPSFVLWGVLAMLVQILVHVVLARCLKDLAQALIDNNIAVGILAGSIQLAVGLINAGSLS